MRAIELENVNKQYVGAQQRALDGICLSLSAGRCYGILGPNGAGKTTLLEIMQGILNMSSGTLRILGMDQAHDLKKIQPLLGIQLQSNAFFDFLSLKQLLRFYADLKACSGQKPLDIDEILALMSLTQHANKGFDQLSGGEKKRFAIAVSLIGDPQIIFLDEPTSDLDPQSRLALWNVIRQLKQDKEKTIVLTTHNMEEAQQLCDQIFMLKGGKLIAQGTPEELVRSVTLSRRVIIRFAQPLPAPLLLPHDDCLREIALTEERHRCEVVTTNVVAAIRILLKWCDVNHFCIEELHTSTTNLEDFFFSHVDRLEHHEKVVALFQTKNDAVHA